MSVAFSSVSLPWDCPIEPERRLPVKKYARGRGGNGFSVFSVSFITLHISKPLIQSGRNEFRFHMTSFVQGCVFFGSKPKRHRHWGAFVLSENRLPIASRWNSLRSPAVVGVANTNTIISRALPRSNTVSPCLSRRSISVHGAGKRSE